jgi:hypothetical protein
MQKNKIALIVGLITIGSLIAAIAARPSYPLRVIATTTMPGRVDVTITNVSSQTQTVWVGDPNCRHSRWESDPEMRVGNFGEDAPVSCPIQCQHKQILKAGESIRRSLPILSLSALPTFASNISLKTRFTFTLKQPDRSYTSNPTTLKFFFGQLE